MTRNQFLRIDLPLWRLRLAWRQSYPRSGTAALRPHAHPLADIPVERWLISRQDHPPRNPEREIRVDGQSRQKFIAVIGSVVAERLDVGARRDFWRAARERLSTYVPDDDRSRSEAALARRVPPPMAEEVEAHDRQRKQRDQRGEARLLINSGRPIR